MFQLSEEKESLLARLYYDAKWKQPMDMESVLEDFDLEEIVNQILSESDHSDPKYKELLDQGIISEEEFVEKKAQLFKHN